MGNLLPKMMRENQLRTPVEIHVAKFGQTLMRCLTFIWVHRHLAVVRPKVNEVAEVQTALLTLEEYQRYRGAGGEALVAAAAAAAAAAVEAAPAPAPAAGAAVEVATASA